MRVQIQALRDLAVAEKRFVAAAKASFAGGFDRWTALDTVNHACSWKLEALAKVRSRARGEEARYRSEEPLEEANRRRYESARRRSRQETIAAVDLALAQGCEVLGAIEGRESSVDLAPIGYEGAVSDYLAFDLIFHPVSHYAYYAIRNDEYEAFLEIEQFVAKYRSSAFVDLSVVDIREFADARFLEEIFDRGYEWRHDDLFILLKSMCA